MDLKPCAVCHSTEIKVVKKHKKAIPSFYNPAYVFCKNCGFIVGKPRSKNSVVGMYMNADYAIKAWNAQAQ